MLFKSGEMCMWIFVITLIMVLDQTQLFRLATYKYYQVDLTWLGYKVNKGVLQRTQQHQTCQNTNLGLLGDLFCAR